MNYLEKEYLVS